MIDETPHPGIAAAISMGPIVARARIVLGEDADPVLAAVMLDALADAYTAGLVDGARDAIAQIVAEAAERGMEIRLGPELLAASAQR